MQSSYVTSGLVIGLLFVPPLFGEIPTDNPIHQPVNIVEIRSMNHVGDFENGHNVEISYDDGRPVRPRRDDPGPDWIFYDDNNPRSLWPVANLWSRVIFTTNADFVLWGVRFMPLNQGPNPDAPCNILVYSEDQDNHNLDELLWEGEIEELEPWDGDNLNNNWHWIELDEDDRIEFDAGEHFSIIYGPAPGGDYRPGQQGAGWWNLMDGATEVRRSHYIANNVSDNYDDWTHVGGGDFFIRANGEYTGGFFDLGVRAVYNAEEEADRRWMAYPLVEKSLFAEIVNEGDEVEEFTVTFEVVDRGGETVFESVVEVDGIEAEELLIVECEDVWEVPREVGQYIVWVTVEAEDDVNEDNDRLGLDQIVYDQEDSREMWIGYTDGNNPDGHSNWNEESGYAVRFDHPGGNIPLWITAFRAGIPANNIDCEFAIHIVDLEDDADELDPGEPAWTGTAQAAGQPFITVELEEDDYVTIHEEEGFLITYLYVNGASFGSDNDPPIAGTAIGMPPAMMQTRNDGDTYGHAHGGDYYIQIQMSGPDHGGVLRGIVTDEANEEPIEGALVETSQMHRDRTDEEGRFEFPFGPHGDFTVSVSKAGYNTVFIDNLHLEDDEEMELEISMLHPECTPSEEEFSTQLEPDMSREFELPLMLSST